MLLNAMLTLKIKFKYPLTEVLRRIGVYNVQIKDDYI